jgi:hypothetical protein
MNAISRSPVAVTALKREAAFDLTAYLDRSAPHSTVFDEAKPIFFAVHPAIRNIGVGLAAWFLAVCSLGFWNGGYVLNVVLAVCAVLLFMYVAVPVVLGRVGSLGMPKVSLHDFNEGEFDTYTGLIAGREAAIQILTVPVCLAVGATCMTLLWNLLR